jgi:hypothetical protein
MELVKPAALVGNGINVRRLDLRVAVATQVVCAVLVGNDQQEVGLTSQARA